MQLKARSLVLLAILTLLLAAVGMVSAQNEVLTLGQPVSLEVSAEAAGRITYNLAEARAISLQALGSNVTPTIRILNGDTLVSAQLNAEAALIAQLNTFLTAGSYTIEIGSANGAEGIVLVVLQSETPVPVTSLAPGVTVSGTADPNAPIALFNFNALAEVSFLYVETQLQNSGVNARLTNTTTGREVANISSDTIGGRIRIPASTSSFQLEVTYSGLNPAEPFTVCFVAVSTGGCETTSAPAAIPTLNAPPPTQESAPAPAGCTVSPANVGSVNIRQSASTQSPIVGFLLANQTANVLGISPDGFFFNIQLDNLNGWVALSVVTANGNCTGLPVVQPPPFVAPTAPPVQPTQPNVPPPASTQEVQPPAQPTQPPTPSGPCLISITAPTNIYQIPVAQIDQLQDQVQAGGELIPVGRLADNSWWRTNYANAWIQTSAFGSTAVVTGDCSGLPIVSP